MFEATMALGADKRKFIERIKTDEGKREFMGVFEERLVEYRELIKKGGDFLLNKEVDDMKATADEIRQAEPNAAKFIDQAREKLEDLLKKYPRKSINN
jgi:hypothetical protein